MTTTSNSTVAASPSSKIASIPVGRLKQVEHKTDIKIEKTDGRVDRIIVHCSCGEETIIDCSYDQESV